MEKQVIFILLFVFSFSSSFQTEEIDSDPAEELEDLLDSVQDEDNAVGGCYDRSRFWCRRYHKYCSHIFMSTYCPKTCGRCSDGRTWSSWSAYGPCSKSCSSGYQSRSRKCNNPSSVQGRSACPGPAEETRRCNENVPCSGSVSSLAATESAEGKWTAWGAYSACTKSCGGGMQSRIRRCINPSHPLGFKSCKGAFRQHRQCNLDPCSVDGGWTQWGQYGPCSKSCGGGVQYKRRKCKNPPPKHGGKKCAGSYKMSRDCNTGVCPVDGQWSPWGQFSQCTKTCGGGSQIRERTCDNPPPSSGGKYCTGSPRQSNVCNAQGCPVDGNWGPWSVFGQCTRPCGGGVKYRTRVCDNPAPGGGGQNCQGRSEETQNCNRHPCAVDGNWSPWSVFGQCSKTCGGGLKYRTRRCDNPAPNSGGKNCQGHPQEAVDCNIHACPVDGNWSPWSVFGQCSRTCGGGLQHRTRSCDDPPPSNGGKSCEGPSRQTVDCNTHACSVDGNWSPWSVFGQCSKTCGGGSKHRTRRCGAPPPSNGGKSCEGPSRQAVDCNIHACPVDGQWSHWSVFSSCTVTCGGGFKYRSRKCDNPAPANGGKNCQGASFHSVACNIKPCPVNAQWSSWSTFGACSKSCGGGFQYRSRKCDNPPPAHGGANCVGPNSQSRSCNSHPCKVDGQWSPWSRYGRCSQSCGGGSQHRSRKCDNPPPSNGGADCVGPNRRSRSCNSHPCKVDGQWSPWSRYGRCSKSCGGGSQYRSRKCDNPPPSNGGAGCVGPNRRSRSCNSHPCKVDGQWSPWSRYGRCSKSCGGGSQYRSRKCDNPPPSNGGADCVGPNRRSRRCNSDPCKVDGQWSPWSRYGRCSKSCGGGSQYRSRKCNNPPPSNGGTDCVGPNRRSRSCNSRPCKVEGGWSPWGPYSKCSRTCGSGGTQTRYRTCSSPYAYGSNACRGYSRQRRRCGSKVPCRKTCRDTRSYGYCRWVMMSYRCGRYYRSCRKTCSACSYH